MIASRAIALINALLARDPHARTRLGAFVGQIVVVHAPPLPNLRLAIGDSGGVAEAPPAGDAQLAIHVPAAALIARLQSRDAFVRELRLEGEGKDRALGIAVREVLATLEWDVEDQLAEALGDVPAHRIASAARAIDRYGREALERLLANVGEYATEERALLASRGQVRLFAHQVARTETALDALEARVAALEALLSAAGQQRR